MEALLVASGVLLAAQYQRNPTKLQIPSFTQSNNEALGDTSKKALDRFGCDPNQKYEPTDICYLDENGCHVNDPRDPCYGNKSTRQINPAGDGTTPQNFQPEAYYYNNRPQRRDPVVMPPNATRHPAEEEMMRDIRNGPSIWNTPAQTAPAYRPSWVRNVVDAAPAPRQERVREWSTETPREAQIHTLPNLDGLYQKRTLQTLNDFGKGGLPFEEQIRVRPDGLDPDPSRRLPTARYHAYALGEDLTKGMGDQGRVRGRAEGQLMDGAAIRQEAWDIMPDRDIQLQPSSAPAPLGGSGVRSGGRGAPLGSFLGSTVEPLPSMTRSSAVEWDMGPTGNKGMIEQFPVRPQDDPLDKRFVYEDIDPTQAQMGVSRFAVAEANNKGFRDVSYDATPLTDEVDAFPKAKNLIPRLDAPKGSASKASETAAWKFSFDMKKLFDMSLPGAPKNRDEKVGTEDDVRDKIVELNANKQVQRIALPKSENARKETAPDKKIILSDTGRGLYKDGTAESKRRVMNFQPKTSKAGTYGGTSVFKTETSSQEKVVSSSAIGVAKKMATEAAAPLGANLSGRSAPIKKSDVLNKFSAENAALSYENDKIFDRAGLLREPLRAPKGTTPDYAQDRVGAMRNAGEFRRR